MFKIIKSIYKWLVESTVTMVREFIYRENKYSYENKKKLAVSERIVLKRKENLYNAFKLGFLGLVVTSFPVVFLAIGAVTIAVNLPGDIAKVFSIAEHRATSTSSVCLDPTLEACYALDDLSEFSIYEETPPRLKYSSETDTSSTNNKVNFIEDVIYPTLDELQITGGKTSKEEGCLIS